MLTIVQGTNRNFYNINPERHSKFIPELQKMGANIRIIDDATADIIRVSCLKNRLDIYGKDIRGTVALVLAALSSPGHSVDYGIGQFDRGYECLDEKLRQIGTNIRRIDKSQVTNLNSRR